MSETEWAPSRLDDEIMQMLHVNGDENVTVLYRRVGDGELRAIRSQEGPDHLWHLSLSHWRRNKRKRTLPKRYPTWDEVIDARTDLLPLNIHVIMHLPQPDTYVALHDPTLHLHEYREAP